MSDFFNRVADEIGLFRIQDQWTILCERIALMVKNAGLSGREDSFPLFPTFLPIDKPERPRGRSILIDIGGTSTKVGIREVIESTGNAEWRVLFEDHNEDFKGRAVPGNSLERFASAVAERVARYLPEELRNKRVELGLGVIWSNALESFFVPGKGVCGRIAGRANYTKHEWFIDDVSDGDDVSDIFLRSFSQLDIHAHRTIIANDTPLTLKAVRGADAGMVASTGVNATLVIEDSSEFRSLYNAEMGTVFKVSSPFLSDGDLVGLGEYASVIEHLIAGRGLPRLFVGNLMKLADSGIIELEDLGKKLKKLHGGAFEIFSAEDLCHLLYNPERFRRASRFDFEITEATVSTLQRLAELLIRRAAKLAGLVAFASISGQLSRKSQFTIALDSRLSRELPLFWNTLRETLDELVPEDKKVTLELVQRVEVPGGVLSVPMLGAAHAIDCV